MGKLLSPGKLAVEYMSASCNGFNLTVSVPGLAGDDLGMINVSCRPPVSQTRFPFSSQPGLFGPFLYLIIVQKEDNK